MAGPFSGAVAQGLGCVEVSGSAPSRTRGAAAHDADIPRSCGSVSSRSARPSTQVGFGVIVLLPDPLSACSAALLVLAVRAAPAPLVALRGPRKSAVPVVPFVQELTAGPRVQRVAAGAGGVVEQLLHGDRHQDDADTVLGDQLPVLQLAFPDDRLGLRRLDQRRPPLVRGLDLVPGPEQHADNGSGSGMSRGR
jgi:hypothetical protein